MNKISFNLLKLLSRGDDVKVIREQKLHLIYTIDDNWQEKAKTKLHMKAKGYEVHDEYLSTVEGLERVVTVFSKEI